MIDLESIAEDILNQTAKGIRIEVIARGWKASVPYLGSPHFFITRDDGKKLHIFSATPSTTSYAAAHLANDKFATYNLLKEINIPQLDTVMVSDSTGMDEALAFMHIYKKVVVKPIDGGHGNGISLNITNAVELEQAIKIAMEHTKSKRAVLVQKEYDYPVIFDLRILCINYTHAASIRRVAARVFGDGVHTIRELIEQENVTSRRGEPYRAELATISIDRAEQHLKERINDIPNGGTEVQVLGIANYGAGGETVDVTDDIPDWLIDYAQDIARTCELPVAGVDFMLSKLPTKESTEEELDPAFTEVNKSPLLAMHDNPTKGIGRGVVKKYMDYLASLD
jgi:cyanophycin synthetase